MGNDPDLLLVIGGILGVLSIPSIVSAFSEGRSPRVASVVVLAAGFLIVYALMNKPGGYTLNEVPQVFMSVIGRYI